MTFEEFESFVKAEAGLGETLERVAAQAAKGRESQVRSFGLGTIAGIGALVILFPIVKRIVYRIGLPWLGTAERYSELWRHEADEWLDEEYRRRGLDPGVSKAASEALLTELEQTTEKESRETWERLVGVMRK
ncbi:MAG: hypothetical protein ACYTEQ_22035 [Planctomycetota bacterium]|jgi:hypothetical protein